MRQIIFLGLFFLSVISAMAQAPSSFRYQAVLRNSSGTIISNQSVSMRFTLWQGYPATNSMYAETQTIDCDANGLMGTAIGIGTPISGNFSMIDWSVGPYWLQTELDADMSGNYIDLGMSQLLSVPYALYAETSGNSFSGDYNDLSNQPQNVSTFTNDAGYLNAEVDGSISNELQVLSISNDTIYLSTGGFVKLPAGFDGNYNSLTNRPDFSGWDTNASNDFDGQYSSLSGKPTNVSAFTNDAGYITADEDSTNELQTLNISNDTLMISEGNVIKLPGVNVSEFIIPTATLATFTTTGVGQYFKIENIGSFIKENDSTSLELIMNCHASIGSYNNCNGVLFQIRIDDQPTQFGKMEFPLFNPNTLYTYFSSTGFFTGISAGYHTVSIWVGAYWSGGTANTIHINPGGYSQSSRMMIKEYYGTFQ